MDGKFDYQYGGGKKGKKNKMNRNFDDRRQNYNMKNGGHNYDHTDNFVSKQELIEKMVNAQEFVPNGGMSSYSMQDSHSNN